MILSTLGARWPKGCRQRGVLGYGSTVKRVLRTVCKMLLELPLQGGVSTARCGGQKQHEGQIDRRLLVPTMWIPDV